VPVLDQPHVTPGDVVGTANASLEDGKPWWHHPACHGSLLFPL
jgi:hypothetical protein